jgi:hypothetical protein
MSVFPTKCAVNIKSIIIIIIIIGTAIALVGSPKKYKIRDQKKRILRKSIQKNIVL